MTNLHQIYQKQVEAWKESYVAKILNDYGSVFLNDALSSRHKDTIELLEAIIKEVEKHEYCSKCCSPKEYCTEWGKYPSAIDTEDLITKLQAEKEKIEKEL